MSIFAIKVQIEQNDVKNKYNIFCFIKFILNIILVPIALNIIILGNIISYSITLIVNNLLSVHRLYY